MLACARIGAIHSVVFGGFAARELATRIDDAKPKLILSASCGLEPGRVVAIQAAARRGLGQLSSAKPERLHHSATPAGGGAAMIEGRDHDWAQLRAAALKAGKSADCVPVAATDPLYILYTSGTTGNRRASCATMAATWSR